MGSREATLSAASRSATSVSAVVVSRNEGHHLRRTVHNLLATLPSDGELVVVDDASTDGSAAFLDGPTYAAVHTLHATDRLGAARARNAGAARSSGDVVVFCDAHIHAPMGWLHLVADPLASPSTGAVGAAVQIMGGSATGYGLTFADATLGVRWLGRQTSAPHTVPLLGGFFLTVRREVFECCGGFDEGMAGWGCEDAELSLRLWSLGYDCIVVPSLVVAHRFRTHLPHALEPGGLTHNVLRLATMHFDAPALDRVVVHLAADPGFPAAVSRLLEGDAGLRRREIGARRTRDANEFFEHFAIEPFAG